MIVGHYCVGALDVAPLFYCWCWTGITTLQYEQRVIPAFGVPRLFQVNPRPANSGHCDSCSGRD